MKRNMLLMLVIVSQEAALCAAELRPDASVTLIGDVTNSTQLSGIAIHGDLLVICPDEGCQFDILRSSGSNSFQLMRSIQLLNDEDKEIDLEGAASDGDYLYLIGSHSSARKQIEPEKSYNKNRARLAEIKQDSNRDQIFRLTLGENGKLKSKERISLRKILNHDEVLGRFTDIPSKENGIDIEGIAANRKHLYIGFRGPVLRGNYVPVMELDFDSPNDYELVFVNLAGRGIRDMAAILDGFLIIAGPVGDGDGSFQLCFWDGRDCIEGDGAPAGKVMVLGQIAAAEGKRAEGLAVLKETEQDCTILIVYDGVKGGDAISLTISKDWH